MQTRFLLEDLQQLVFVSARIPTREHFASLLIKYLGADALLKACPARTKKHVHQKAAT